MAATIRTFAGKHPELGRGVFLAETSAVIGDVVVGEEDTAAQLGALAGECANRCGHAATITRRP